MNRAKDTAMLLIIQIIMWTLCGLVVAGLLIGGIGGINTRG